jgi:hypothetical protein
MYFRLRLDMNGSPTKYQPIGHRSIRGRTVEGCVMIGLRRAEQFGGSKL